MDKKILAGIIVGIVLIGGVAGIILATMNNDSGSKDHGYTTLARTNELFPDHTCCVIVGKQTFLDENPNTSIRFLKAYVNGVNYLNNALKDKSSEDYQKVMDISKTQLKSADISEKEIEESLKNITYLYQDSTDNLDGLKTDVSNLIDSLTGIPADRKTAIMNGKFVDDTFITQVGGTPGAAEKANVSVCVIAGDIHQIALHIANELGYFTDLGITLTVKTGGNGGDVATTVSLTSGDGTDFGLLGAPPATLATVNKRLIEDSNPGRFSIVARVNTEGSGLYIKESVLDDKGAEIPARNGTPFYAKSGDVYTVSAANAKAWGGLVFATPGMTSIQHVQLEGLVKSMGLKWEMYQEGSSLDEDTVYFKTNINTADLAFNDISINAGIIWEPQFQKVITE